MNSSNQLFARNGKTPIQFISRFHQFSDHAGAFMEIEGIKEKALDAADRYLDKKPKAKIVYLEIIGAFADFQACEILVNFDLLAISKNGLMTGSFVHLRLRNGKEVLLIEGVGVNHT